ncbi:YaiI/YqxD family protein [Vagococcus teuberi]|uniref:UPF0178 protein BHY08_04445 n=1 Tax=Vagococcus teuberi TaxID=519472 RepID=A0A1J0A5D5_9ENTE|nr:MULTISPECIES: YaiI/YqxD family protein [Vagococcus]APB31144.1 hypothetical protein BHY08_04445 [Vagococcus teuberi]RHH71303.1 YaiI/YqxD family protein [Vagococcus sp. AM17-17]
MRFVIDGDGSPVKNEVIQLGETYQIPVVIVTSIDHYTNKIYPDFIEFIYVDKGSDSADYRIVKEVEDHDIIITQDYGLASLLLTKPVRVFHHSGQEYTTRTIDTLLNQRFIGSQMRKAGKKTKGPKAFTQKDKEIFIGKMLDIIKSKNNLG